MGTILCSCGNIWCTCTGAVKCPQCAAPRPRDLDYKTDVRNKSFIAIHRPSKEQS